MPMINAKLWVIGWWVRNESIKSSRGQAALSELAGYVRVTLPVEEQSRPDFEVHHDEDQIGVVFPAPIMIQTSSIDWSRE